MTKNRRAGRSEQRQKRKFIWTIGEKRKKYNYIWETISISIRTAGAQKIKVNVWEVAAASRSQGKAYSKRSMSFFFINRLVDGRYGSKNKRRKTHL